MTETVPLTRGPERGRRHGRVVGCDCGGPCFYCGRALSRHRHEHDHFPIPARYDGDATVPACRECHSLKDRVMQPGIRRDGSVDGPVWRAITAGMAGLPMAVCAPTGDEAPAVMWTLYDRMCDWGESGRFDWKGDSWLLDEIETFGRFVSQSVVQCTTPEARIFLARLFAIYMDIINDGLMQEEGARFP